jgi:hypothetical protein
VPDGKGAGRNHDHGHAPNGKAGYLPNKTCDSANQVGYQLALCIERTITVDMDDGQSLPPYIDDGVVWHVVRRANGHTVWRRIFLNPSFVTPGAASPEDQSRAP